MEFGKSLSSFFEVSMTSIKSYFQSFSRPLSATASTIPPNSVSGLKSDQQAASGFPATSLDKEHAKSLGLSPKLELYKVLESRFVSPDSKVIKIGLRHGQDLHFAGIPSGVKIQATINGQVLEKSYSPINLPSDPFMELLVKGYGKESEGLGQYLVDLEPGNEIEMFIKPRRLFWGAPYTPNRWKWVGLVCCGTGVAPFIQLTRGILANKEDETKIFMVNANRTEDDILMKEELDDMQNKSNGQFHVYNILSQPSQDFKLTAAERYGIGRISLDHLKKNMLERVHEYNLHPQDGVVLICGTDQFLETVSGKKIKIVVPGKDKKEKLQGPLLGFLKELGLSESQVVKF